MQVFRQLFRGIRCKTLLLSTQKKCDKNLTMPLGFRIYIIDGFIGNFVVFLDILSSMRKYYFRIEELFFKIMPIRRFCGPMAD